MAKDEIFVIVDKNVKVYEAYRDEEDAHLSIAGEESSFDVYRVKVREDFWDE